MTQDHEIKSLSIEPGQTVREKSLLVQLEQFLEWVFAVYSFIAQDVPIVFTLRLLQQTNQIFLKTTTTQSLESSQNFKYLRH